MGLLEETRPIRRALFELIQQPPEDGPVSLLRYQLELADAIRSAEACLRRRGVAAYELVHHVERLRTYADGFAWLILHPHAIRQMAKNELLKKSLIEQESAFDGVLAVAGRLCASTGLPVLIADITNVIRIGDLLLVADTENPTIVECKSHMPDTTHLMQGRIGRQISRSVGTARYLERDSTKVFGDDHYRLAVEANYDHDWHWDEVESVCRNAIKDGLASQELSIGNWIWAMRPGHEDTALQQVAELAKGCGKWQFGTPLGARDDLYAPPCAWPLPQDLRFEISEGTVIIFRAIDYESFAGDYGGGRKIEIGDVDSPLVVSIDDKEARLSARFVYDALYGYETVASCVNGILEFVQRIDISLADDLPAPAASKPSVHDVDNVKALEEILGQSDVPDNDLIAFPVEDLSRFMLGEVLLADSSGRMLSLLRVRELRRLLSAAGDAPVT